MTDFSPLQHWLHTATYDIGRIGKPRIEAEITAAMERLS